MLFTHSASFSSPPPTEGFSASSSAGTSPPSSTSRSSRLRRFSHLRSYTPSHLLSRDSSGNSSGGESLTRTTSEVASIPRSAQRLGPGTGRSGNRLTLINSAPSHSRPVIPSANNRDPASTRSASPYSPQAAGEFDNTLLEDPAPGAEDPSSQSSEPRSPQSSPEPAVSSDDDQPEERQEPSQIQPQPQQEPQAAIMTRARASTTGDAVSSAAVTAATTAADFLPSIRLSAYYDPRSTRPSLTFPPISRTLPTGTESIRVGRYSERDSHSMSNMPNNQPSAAPVGFKSKVVSRRHCEFWYENGKWFIKDVKSSSGTFLNHIRLSPPSQESKAFPINDGDIVQLGIDFKGGEEMIFRCVKMRIELNRGWQNKLNTFNMAAHKRLRTMASSNSAGSGAGASSSQDCSICLNSIAPCQSLFVAPCSHTWHFKCVRSLLTSPQYPIFICPNCRAGADLEADVDDPAEDWEQLEAEGENGDKSSMNGAPLAPALAPTPAPAPALAQPDQPGSSEQENSSLPEADVMDVTINISAADSSGTSRGNLPHATSEPLPIRNPTVGSSRTSMARGERTPSPPANGAEGPITPRNEAGPWVFDGSAGWRAAAQPETGMRSLDAAADLTVRNATSDS